eukprot:789166-Prorocentrum_minimum.AAC.1
MQLAEVKSNNLRDLVLQLKQEKQAHARAGQAETKVVQLELKVVGKDQDICGFWHPDASEPHVAVFKWLTFNWARLGDCSAEVEGGSGGGESARTEGLT